MSILARSKPYPVKQPGSYTCQRCGITKTRTGYRRPLTHCRDCKPYAPKDD